MSLNFPNNPGIGDTYGLGRRVWSFNGDGWELVPNLPFSPQGTQGLQGRDGAFVAQGTQGTTIQGLQGKAGNLGDQGTQGIRGSQGTQGIQGLSNQGLQGLQGLQGTSGKESPTGGILPGGDVEKIFFLSEVGIDTSYTIPTGYNAMSVGPHVIGAGVSVVIPSGSNWIIIEP